MNGQLTKLDTAIILIVAIMTMAVSVETAAKFQLEYAVPRTAPSQTGLGELQWIKNHYGYDNPKVVIMIRDTDSYLWALAYNGGFLYYGDLFYLLSNQTENQLENSTDLQVKSAYVGTQQKMWSYGILGKISPETYTILVPGTTYAPDPIEMQVLVPVGGGVYIVKPTDPITVTKLFITWKFAKSSEDIIRPSLPYTIVHPVGNCTTYASATSDSKYQTLKVTTNLTNFMPCSLSILYEPPKPSTSFLSMEFPKAWDVSLMPYFGFYFKGLTNLTHTNDFVFQIRLSTNSSSYYYCDLANDLWNNQLQGLLVGLNQFQYVGIPSWASITSMQVGIQTDQKAFFHYNMEYAIFVQEVS